MKRFKILHLITRLCVGGAQKNTLLTVERMDKNKWDVYLAAGALDDKEGSMEDEVPADIPYTHFPNLQRELHPIKDFRAFLELYAFIRKHRFDIVHTHISKAGILGRFAAKLAKVPVIVHTPHGHVFHSYYGFLKTSIFKLLEKMAVGTTDKMIALTGQERDEHLALGIGAREKFEVIQSGIDIENFSQKPDETACDAVRKRWALTREHRVVGTVARLVPVKGHEFLIQAMPEIIQSFSKARFLFVGDGEKKEDLIAMAKKLGVHSHLIITGHQTDVRAFYSLMDVFVLPSLNEGMGRVILEAMSGGVPVVATSVGGILNLVQHEQTGVLVPPRDSAALSRAVVDLLSDAEKAKQIAARAKKQLPLFTADNMVQKIEALYETLLKEKSF